MNQPRNINRVLIADDDPIFCEVVQAIFTQRDIQTYITSNGAEAKSILSERIEEIDLIVCDLNMPEFDGIEFLKYLQSNAPDTKLIIVSGSEPIIFKSAVKLAKFYSLNLIDVFTKPLNIEKFSALID